MCGLSPVAECWEWRWGTEEAFRLLRGTYVRYETKPIKRGLSVLHFTAPMSGTTSDIKRRVMRG